MTSAHVYKKSENKTLRQKVKS